eukprot:TRINITY_DN1753_c0_g2_i1.p1 TRINITY_DN1753_c0_g2~~TRINITY_DN1753_c0_g2_i1.p1  ORF type:complete len:241 (+),score=22.66 TRINITY_DN1753_c0_g2_i1:646-1368(+)
MLSRLMDKAGLRVVAEVAVSSDYEVNKVPWRAYGSVDQVLIPSHDRFPQGTDGYTFDGATRDFKGEVHEYRPPFFSLLGWETKSRFSVEKCRDGTSSAGDAISNDGPESSHQQDPATPSSKVHGVSLVPDVTPGKQPNRKTLDRSHIVRGHFYGKALREANHEMYVERSHSMQTAADDDMKHFLPMIVSDSYNFVFCKRFLSNQIATGQLNMDSNEKEIVDGILWALFHAVKLQDFYFPP